MKILIITHNFPPRREVSRDAGTFILSFVLSLSKIGHRVYVLMPDIPEEKEDYPEFRIVWFPWKGGDKLLGKLKWYLPRDILSIISLVRSGVREAVKIIEREGIEYCSAMWAIPSGYFAYIARRKLGTPYSVWVLGSDIWTYTRPFFLRCIIGKVIKNAQRVFSNSIYLKERVRDMFGIEPHILYAIRSLPLNTPPANVQKEKVNFLFIGRYEEVKGLDILLKAFKMLLKEKRNIYLYAFGGGSLRDRYIEMVEELGIKEYVSIRGYASPEVAVSFLRACRCLVIPSRKESQPVLLMDAIQVKTPVIVTRAGDMAEIVTRFNIGEVVDIEDIQGLKQAMSRFIDRRGAEYTENLENISKLMNPISMAERYAELIKG